MSNYEILNEKLGIFNTSYNDREDARTPLDALLFELKRARQRGGFDPAAVMRIVSFWFRAGEKLRRAHYARLEYPNFIRETPPPPSGHKVSELLLKAVDKLRDYPPHAAAGPQAEYFLEAERLMILFVGEFRKKLTASDREGGTRFVNELILTARSIRQNDLAGMR